MTIDFLQIVAVSPPSVPLPRYNGLEDSTMKWHEWVKAGAKKRSACESNESYLTGIKTMCAPVFFSERKGLVYTGIYRYINHSVYINMYTILYIHVLICHLHSDMAGSPCRPRTAVCKMRRQISASCLSSWREVTSVLYGVGGVLFHTDQLFILGSYLQVTSKYGFISFT